VKALVLPYWGALAASVKSQVTYRTAFFTSVLWSVLSMTLIYYLWTAIIAQSTTLVVAPQALITYVCLGQAFSFGRPGQRNTFMRIREGIRSGNVAVELLRPADYQGLQLAATAGSFVLDLALVALPSYLLAFFFFGISGPVSPVAALGFGLSLLGAYVLVSTLDFFLGILVFWTRSAWGLGYLKMAIMDILGGAIIPLALFPDWLRTLADVLPFKDMAYTPLAIYTGILPESAIPGALAGHLAWAVGLVVATRLLWNVARRRLEVQGG